MKLLRFEIAGHPETDLFVDPGPCHCGGIVDGVAFKNGNTGVWIVDFKDIQKIYESAVAARSEE